MRLVIIGDFWDPGLGSEFQVIQKILRELAFCARREIPVVVFTLSRLANGENISRWLRQNPIPAAVDVRVVPARFAKPSGDHPSRIHFLLDLARLWREAVTAMRPGDGVWRCGQVNFLFSVFFFFFRRVRVLGPLSGFTFPPILRAAKSGNMRLAAWYFIYSLLIAACYIPVVASFLMRRGRGRVFLAATDQDRKRLIALGAEFSGARVIRVSEVDIEGVRNMAPPVPHYAHSHEGEPGGACRQRHLLWAGQLIHRKNPSLGVEVAGALLDRYPDWSATFVGGGPLRKGVINRIAGVRFAGGKISLSEPLKRQEFLTKLAAADVLLITSFREVNCVTAIEAMSLDVLVVSPATGGIAQLVIESGGALYTEGVDSPAVIAERINLAYEKRVQGRAREKVAALYRREALEIRGVLEDLLRGQSCN